MSRPAAARSDARRRRILAQGLLSPEQPDVEAEAPAVVPAEPVFKLVPEERFLPIDVNSGLATVRRLLQESRPMVWLFSGDNIFQGAQYTGGARCLPELFGERIRCELRRVLDVVINTGVSGDTARDLLRTLKWRILRYKAEVVSLSIGLNDAKAGHEGRRPFRKDVRELLDRIREAEGVPVVHLPHFVHLPAVKNRPELPAYIDILRDEAARMEAPVVDHWTHWQRLHADPESLGQWLGDGRMQPNHYGHRELARLTFHTFDILDTASPTCRLAVP